MTEQDKKYLEGIKFSVEEIPALIDVVNFCNLCAMQKMTFENDRFSMLASASNKILDKIARFYRT